MATASAAARSPKELVFEWEGKDKNGKVVRGEIRAGGEAVVSASLRFREADPLATLEAVEEELQLRLSKHPHDSRCAGSSQAAMSCA